MKKNYDLIVIGAGPGGYVAAIRAAQLKAKVCVVEKDNLGGVCLNRGCIPTKAIINSVNLFSRIKLADEIGIKIKEVKADYGRIMARKDKVVAGLRTGIFQLFKARSIEVVNGHARITGPGEVEVKHNSKQKKIKADKIIIATGSEPVEIPIAPFDGRYVLNTDHILFSKNLPKSILIIGGGVIGCEFAHIYAELGVKVSIVEMMDRLLPTEDQEVGRRLATAFKKKGIEVKTKCRVEKVSINKGVIAELNTGQSLKADQTLVCVGRRPNIQDLGLEEVGIRTEKGCILVNENLKTNISGIYAIGDVIGGSYLAHVASYEGILAANNIFGQTTQTRDYKVVPSCIFSEPEIASVGLSEEEARAAGYEVKIGKLPFTALGKAHILGQTEGFVKLIGDAKTDEILGGIVMGPSAASLIAEIALGMKLEATMAEICETIHAHPTLPEATMEAAAAFYGEAIHMV